MNGRATLILAFAALILVSGAYALSVGPFTADGLRAALGDADFHEEMGFKLGTAGDWDGAKHAFARAVALEPTRESARRNLAIASFHAGDYETAITNYRILLADDTGNREYRFDLAQSLVAHARTVETDGDAAVTQLHEALDLLENVGNYPHAHENAQIIRAVLSEVQP